MIESLDARARHWPTPLRWIYVCIKWSLVALGAAMIVGHFVLTWGWFAGLWFVIAPLLYGMVQGLRSQP